MSRIKAQAILDFIAGNGGRVGDGEVFRQKVPLDAADLADLTATGWSMRAGAGRAAVDWNVLFPVRLETRFLPPGKQGPNQDSDPTIWRLLVRVEPDAPAMATRPAPDPTRRGAAGSCLLDRGGRQPRRRKRRGRFQQARQASRAGSCGLPAPLGAGEAQRCRLRGRLAISPSGRLR